MVKDITDETKRNDTKNQIKPDKSTTTEINDTDNLPAPNYLGHRLRLRERFMRSPIRTTSDYEILEMLLFRVFQRKDTKGISKALLKKYGSLIAIFSAEPLDLQTVNGVGQSVIEYFKLLQDTFSRLLLPVKIDKIHVMNSWLAVLNYCQLTMGFKKKEYFRALFLNKKNLLVADELFDSGTVDKVIVYPREIAKQALSYSASAVIIVHNHPSGDAQPSTEDIDITKKISAALNSINITLHDHLIIAQNEHFSFKANGIL